MTLLAKNKEEVTLDDLRKIPLPEPTESYKPVGHYDLIFNIAGIADNILNEYELTRKSFGTARNGNQMFGVLTYNNQQASDDDLGLSIGFRNSYDKSMSVGICIGASVLVCDNMVFQGEITVLRKHTKNVWESLRDMAITTIYQSQTKFSQLTNQIESLKDQRITDRQAFQTMGLLYGKDVISTRQLPRVKREWTEPSYEQFEPRTMWSLYNAITEALKTSPPSKIMEKHINLHEELLN